MTEVFQDLFNLFLTLEILGFFVWLVYIIDGWLIITR